MYSCIYDVCGVYVRIGEMDARGRGRSKGLGGGVPRRAPVKVRAHTYNPTKMNGQKRMEQQVRMNMTLAQFSCGSSRGWPSAWT